MHAPIHLISCRVSFQDPSHCKPLQKVKRECGVSRSGRSQGGGADKATEATEATTVHLSGKQTVQWRFAEIPTIQRMPMAPTPSPCGETPRRCSASALSVSEVCHAGVQKPSSGGDPVPPAGSQACACAAMYLLLCFPRSQPRTAAYCFT